MKVAREIMATTLSKHSHNMAENRRKKQANGRAVTEDEMVAVTRLLNNEKISTPP